MYVYIYVMYIYIYTDKQTQIYKYIHIHTFNLFTLHQYFLYSLYSLITILMSSQHLFVPSIVLSSAVKWIQEGYISLAQEQSESSGILEFWYLSITKQTQNLASGNPESGCSSATYSLCDDLSDFNFLKVLSQCEPTDTLEKPLLQQRRVLGNLPCVFTSVMGIAILAIFPPQPPVSCSVAGKCLSSSSILCTYIWESHWPAQDLILRPSCSQTWPYNQLLPT